jgi:hypothetical protein
MTASTLISGFDTIAVTFRSVPQDNIKRLLRPQVDSEANGKTVAMVRMPVGLPDLETWKHIAMSNQVTVTIDARIS